MCIFEATPGQVHASHVRAGPRDSLRASTAELSTATGDSRDSALEDKYPNRYVVSNLICTHRVLYPAIRNICINSMVASPPTSTRPRPQRSQPTPRRTTSTNYTSVARMTYNFTDIKIYTASSQTSPTRTTTLSYMITLSYLL
jgi:hypothetical protein